MTAPDKILVNLDSNDDSCCPVEDASNQPEDFGKYFVAEYATIYVRADLVQAAVAAAYEAAAQVCANHAVIAARTNQDQANSLLRSSEAGIRALSTPDQITALAAERVADQAEITRLRAVIAKDAAQMIDDQHKLHKAVEALREVIDFACALNNVAAGQNPEQLDRWSAVLAALAVKVDASQAPNPAVNGGRCQSGTITLPRAEAEVMMATLASIDRPLLKVGRWMDMRIAARAALAALQERMK